MAQETEGMSVNPEHIDFISSYCDRWCERCSFTNRCSRFTGMAAVAMCGDDAAAGLELAFGRAPDDDGVRAPLPEWAFDLENARMSPQEEEEWQRKYEESQDRVKASPISRAAYAFMNDARVWLTANRDALATADDVVREALEVAEWDYMFICVKLNRALDGKDELDRDIGVDDDWSRQDVDGTAKIALISIVRSTEAFEVLASATGLDAPALVASQLKDLREAVEREFPGAWKFRRPGFDDERTG
jgi:hypothetical protein